MRIIHRVVLIEYIGVMGIIFWKSPSSCMLDRLECVHMNGVKSIRARVGG